MKIGLLEDNPTTVSLLTTALKMEGHTVFHYSEGSTLLEDLFAGHRIAAALPYDLLLVDLHLPRGLSGVAVIASIRAAIPPERLPLIVISAASKRELEALHASHPDVPTLQKPLKLKHLAETIERSIKGRATPTG
jgi:DNA-binding response OmpR family regulator